MAVFVDDQNGVDGGGRLFKLAQLHVQRGLRGLDLLVGQIAGNGVDAAKVRSTDWKIAEVCSDMMPRSAHSCSSARAKALW